MTLSNHCPKFLDNTCRCPTIRMNELKIWERVKHFLPLPLIVNHGCVVHKTWPILLRKCSHVLQTSYDLQYTIKISLFVFLQSFQFNSLCFNNNRGFKVSQVSQHIVHWNLYQVPNFFFTWVTFANILFLTKTHSVFVYSVAHILTKFFDSGQTCPRLQLSGSSTVPSVKLFCPFIF